MNKLIALLVFLVVAVAGALGFTQGFDVGYNKGKIDAYTEQMEFIESGTIPKQYRQECETKR